jgi:bifunctional N-acetylglucosamine-1-phosphate-uridyltransferase/glucosamine-1-phosphate-acetyltransferase GlmU-like protein
MAHDINDFIIDTFPMGYDRLMKQEKSKITESIEEADAGFEQKLTEIIEDKKEDKKETS